MTLLQLKYFCTACECGSITKAAEKLFVTQPTITLAIRELEKKYQISLLTRKGRGFNLTSDGKKFYKQAIIMLEYADEFDRQINDIILNSRYIRLGITRAIGSSVYAEYFSCKKNNHHGVNIQLKTASSAQLLEQLRRHQLDLIIIPDYGIDSMNDMEKTILKHSKMFYCMSVSHPLASVKNITVPMIINEKMISTNNDDFKMNFLSQLFQKNGYNKSPNVVQQFEQLNTVMKMIEANLGTGYFSEDAIKQYTGIESRIIEGDSSVPVYLIWTKSSCVRKEVCDFIDGITKFYNPLSNKTYA